SLPLTRNAAAPGPPSPTWAAGVLPYAGGAGGTAVQQACALWANRAPQRVDWSVPRASVIDVNLNSSASPTSPQMNGGGSYGLDDHIYQRLLKERIIFLGSEVRDANANAICAALLLLSAEDPEADIFLHINSPGGSV